MKSKMESIKEIIKEEKPDIIGLVETHLQEGEFVKIEGYVIIRNDRNQKGGGVLMGIKEKYRNVYVKKEIEKINNLESIWIHIG